MLAICLHSADFDPHVKTSLSDSRILTFISSWNSFLWPLLVTNEKKYRLLNNGLAAFTTESGSDVHLQMAAATFDRHSNSDHLLDL